MIHFKWIYCQCDKPTETQYCYGKKRLKRYMFFNSNTPWKPKVSKKTFITNCIYSLACRKDNGPTMRVYKKRLRYYFCICKAQEVTLSNIWIAHISTEETYKLCLCNIMATIQRLRTLGLLYTQRSQSCTSISLSLTDRKKNYETVKRYISLQQSKY